MARVCWCAFWEDRTLLIFLGNVVEILRRGQKNLSRRFLEGLFFLNGCVLFWGGLAKVCQSVFRPLPPNYLLKQSNQNDNYPTSLTGLTILQGRVPYLQAGR